MLESINQQWHQQLDELYRNFLIHLTALELDKADQDLQQFTDSLSAHLEFEEKYIDPLCTGVADDLARLIDADHTILERLLKKVIEGVQHLHTEPKDQQQAEVVEQLGTYLKLRNVLTHHDLREVQQLYPHLIGQVPAEQLETLGVKMKAVFDAL